MEDPLATPTGFLPVTPNLGNSRPAQRSNIFKDNVDPDVQRMAKNKKKVDIIELEHMPTQEEQTTTKDEKSPTSWLIIVLAFIVILLIIVIVYYTLKNQNTSPEIPQEVLRPGIQQANQPTGYQMTPQQYYQLQQEQQAAAYARQMYAQKSAVVPPASAQEMDDVLATLANNANASSVRQDGQVNQDTTHEVEREVSQTTANSTALNNQPNNQDVQEPDNSSDADEIVVDSFNANDLDEIDSDMVDDFRKQLLDDE